MLNSHEIIFYGTKWCGDCRRAKKIFAESNVDYIFIDIDQDHAAEAWVKSKNRGNRSVPTLLFPDGSFLVEPSDQELTRKLKDYLKKYIFN